MDKIFILQDKKNSYLFYIQADDNKSHKIITIDRLKGDVMSVESIVEESDIRSKYEVLMKQKGVRRV